MAEGLVDGLGFGDLDSEAEEGSSRWIHVPAKSRLKVVVLSDRAYRYEGHWVGNRMMVCPGAGCEWHARRMGVQVRYCLSVLDVDTRARCFLEIGAQTAKQIAAAASEAGRLRGLIFELRHEADRKNGRLLASGQDAWSALALLPEAEDPAPQIKRQALAERSTTTRMPDSWVAPAGFAVDESDAPSRNGSEKAAAAGTSTRYQHSGGR